MFLASNIHDAANWGDILVIAVPVLALIVLIVIFAGIRRANENPQGRHHHRSEHSHRKNKDGEV